MIDHQQPSRPIEEPILSVASRSDLPSTFADLFCREESSDAAFYESPISRCSAECTEIPWEEQSMISRFIVGERHFVPDGDYRSRFVSSSPDASARGDSIAWMLKVQAYYGFQPLTVYLAVNYMDRFLCSHKLPQTNGWPMHLLSVACLSLAAKMEEPLVPGLLDFQVECPKYVFESRTIGRMELLVLTALRWRLRSITPFSFIDFFAFKLDPSGYFFGNLISRASEIILSSIKETSFLLYLPSSIAASAMLCAGSEIPKLSPFTTEHATSWCDGLSKENIVGCYQFLRGLAVSNGHRNPLTADPPIPTRLGTSYATSPHKKRKLNDCSPIDDGD